MRNLSHSQRMGQNKSKSQTSSIFVSDKLAYTSRTQLSDRKVRVPRYPRPEARTSPRARNLKSKKQWLSSKRTTLNTLKLSKTTTWPATLQITNQCTKRCVTPIKATVISLHRGCINYARVNPIGIKCRKSSPSIEWHKNLSQGHKVESAWREAIQTNR